MGILDIINGVNNALDFINDPSGDKRRRDEDWERTFGHKIGRPWEKVETYGEQRLREFEEKSKQKQQDFEEAAALEQTEMELDNAKEELARQARIQELQTAYESSGRKENFAEASEVETLLTLTEKKIIQQCRRPKCHGCKLGWICPKFWS